MSPSIDQGESSASQHIQTPGDAGAQENGEQNNHASLARKDRIACIIIVVVAILAMIPVFKRGFPAGDDAGVHYRWATQFNEALGEKDVFYPRWLPSANNNRGNPTMLFYPPLPFYVTSFFSLFTSDTLKALSLASLLALALSGLAMYALCRPMLPTALSLLAALLYLLAPYHLYDLCIGSALSEF